ncbi:unnamed protein product [Rhodiola kirilowii]
MLSTKSTKPLFREKFNKPDSESSIEYRSDFIRRKYELQQFSSYSADVFGTRSLSIGS